MTEWFKKEAGDEVLIGMDEGIGESQSVLIIGDILPDWVRTPPELGGAKVGVLGGFMDPCPRCRGEAPVVHMKLENGMYVAECKGACGFVWYRPKLVPKPTKEPEDE